PCPVRSPHSTLSRSLTLSQFFETAEKWSRVALTSPARGRRSDEEVAVHRRASRLRPAPRRVRDASGGCLPADGHPGGYVLRVEEEVRQPRGAGSPRVAADARGKCAAEAAGGRPDARQADPAGGDPKKNLKPARRRELAQWVRDRYQVSCRRACALAR